MPAFQGCMNNITFGDDSLGYYETVAGGAGAVSRLRFNPCSVTNMAAPVCYTWPIRNSHCAKSLFRVSNMEPVRASLHCRIVPVCLRKLLELSVIA